MRTLICRFICVVAITLCPESAHPQNEPLDAFGWLLRYEYFVGEPVDFYVAVRNLSVSSQLVPGREALDRSFEVLVSSRMFVKGNRYFSIRFFGSPEPVPEDVPMISLKSGDWYIYRIRVLYSFGPPASEKPPPGPRLVLQEGMPYKKPGEYYIKVKLRFFESASAGPAGKQVISRRFVIRYPKPATPEAKVWEEIRRPEILAFLQTGGERFSPDVALAVARILRDFPASRYQNDLQLALARYFRKHWRKHNVAQRALIETALKLKFPPEHIPTTSARALRYLKTHAPTLYRDLDVKLDPAAFDPRRQRKRSVPGRREE